jgi:hypothetical protein
LVVDRVATHSGWLASGTVVLADLSLELLAVAREHLDEVDSRTQACVEEIVEADAF